MDVAEICRIHEAHLEKESYAWATEQWLDAMCHFWGYEKKGAPKSASTTIKKRKREEMEEAKEEDKPGETLAKKAKREDFVRIFPSLAGSVSHPPFSWASL